jgi:glycerophosphoryl diester phosphodiesterase
MDAKVIFSSYDTEIADYLGKKWDLVSALDTYSLSALNKLDNTYFTYFMTPSDNFSDTLVKQLQMKWIESVAYVVNDPTVFQKLASRWVRFVMTDEISKLKKAIQK